MNDLISRSALLEALAKRQVVDECADHGLDWKNATLETKRTVEIQGAAIKRIINIAPAVDAVPVRHGKWIYNPNANDWGIGGYVCSECSAKNGNLPSGKVASPMVFVGSKFCPNCGARMDEGGSGDGQTQD